MSDFFEHGGRLLVDTINSGVAVYEVRNDGASGRDYVILYFNKTALELEGKSLDEVVGRTLFDLRPNIDEFGLIPVFRSVWKTGEPAHYPARVYVDESFSNWYENRVFRLSPSQIVAVYDDVTDRMNAAEALRRSESLLREVIDSMDKAIAIYQPVDDGRDFVFLGLNEFGERITHYRVDEVIGKRLSHLFPEEASVGLIGKLKEVLDTGQTARIPLKQYKDDRITQWVESTIYKLPSGMVMAVFEDTYEQRSAEAALKDSEEKLRRSDARYREAERIGRLGHWEYDLATEEFWGSTESRRIYGFGPDDKRFTADEVESRIPERERVHQALVDLVERDEPYDLVFEINPIGSTRPTTITSIARLVRDPSGKPLRVTGIIQDITERKRMEDELRAGERRYRSLFNGIRDAIFVTDSDWNVVDCNQAFCELFGHRADDVLGQCTSAFAADASEHQRLTGALEQGGAAAVDHLTTVQLRKRDGTLFPGEANVFRMPGGDGGFIVSIRDVTERRILEEQVRQAQKMEAVGKLAGGVAHDFNNLLTIINGYSDMLLARKRPDGDGYEELKQIEQAGHRAAALTGQLLAFSRRQVLAPEVLDVNHLIRHTKQMLQRLVGEHIRLVTRLEPTVRAIRADRSQFDQIIMNLAVNARDAMPRGGTLTIETRNVPSEDKAAPEPGVPATEGQVLLAVTDDGVGMPPEVLERIFEPFFTTKEQGKGTGMGLSTVFGIVKQSGGDIHASSEPGRGTSIRIYFPAVGDAPSDSEPPPSVRAYAQAGHETILVVEDEPSVRRLIARALSQCGYDLITASSGSEALEIVRSCDRPIHLLLTDVIMPGITGPELADAFRKARPGAHVCFMSGYTDDALGPHGVLAADAHFIQKPFVPLELIGKIRGILGAG